MSNKVNINEIIQNSNIVDVVSSYVPLKQKGKNFWGVCPFHDDSEPSMSVSREKGLFKCFSCQAGGNVIAFLTRFNKWTFIDAAKFLAQQQGVELDFQDYQSEKIEYSPYETEILEALKDAMNAFSFLLFDSKDQKLKNYLTERKLNTDLIKHFGIGFGDDEYLGILKRKGHKDDVLINAFLMTEENWPFFKNRLVFAIKNAQGDIVGYSGRSLDPYVKSAKYINSGESSLFNKSELLYNYHLAKNAIDYTKEIIVVEGFMDVIAYYRDSIENVVAIMGTALTEQHLKLIKKNKVTLSLDGDKAGIAATVKSLFLLIKNHIDTYVLVNKTNLDPDEILTQNGKGALQKFFQENKISGIEFLYQLYKNETNLESYESVQKFTKIFSELLSYLEKEKSDFYVAKIERELKIHIFPQKVSYVYDNQKDFRENKPFDPEFRRQKFVHNFIEQQSDPFAEGKSKCEALKNGRSEMFLEIIMLLLKNPDFFTFFHINELPWDNLDQLKIVENLAANALGKKIVNLNSRQEQIKSDYQTRADQLTKFEYSNNVEDFEIKINNLKKQIDDVSIVSGILNIKEEQDSHLIDNVNGLIKKRHKNREKDS